MKKRPYWLERKLKKMRKKYFEGYASEEYIRTGIPRIIRERTEESEKKVQKMMKQNKKNLREAKKNYKKNHKEDFDEDKVIFV